MPEITKIESVEFGYRLEDTGRLPNGFDIIYDPGNSLERKLFGLKIRTDTGVTGEYVGGNSAAFAQINMVAQYLVGRDPLKRERHWSELKRALRKYDRMALLKP